MEGQGCHEKGFVFLFCFVLGSPLDAGGHICQEYAFSVASNTRVVGRWIGDSKTPLHRPVVPFHLDKLCLLVHSSAEEWDSWCFTDLMASLP